MMNKLILAVMVAVLVAATPLALAAQNRTEGKAAVAVIMYNKTQIVVWNATIIIDKDAHRIVVKNFTKMREKPMQKSASEVLKELEKVKTVVLTLIELLFTKVQYLATGIAAAFCSFGVMYRVVKRYKQSRVKDGWKEVLED